MMYLVCDSPHCHLLHMGFLNVQSFSKTPSVQLFVVLGCSEGDPERQAGAGHGWQPITGQQAHAGAQVCGHIPDRVCPGTQPAAPEHHASAGLLHDAQAADAPPDLQAHRPLVSELAAALHTISCSTFWRSGQRGMFGRACKRCCGG
eukprot:294830-Pelagomonas_calceolata.AAC.3